MGAVWYWQAAEVEVRVERDWAGWRGAVSAEGAKGSESDAGVPGECARRSHAYRHTLCCALIPGVGPQLEVLGDVQCQPVSQLKFVLDAMHQVPNLRTGTQLAARLCPPLRRNMEVSLRL